MNRGIEIAQGEWVGIVEPDDWIEPQMYERLLAAATDAVDVVKTNFVSVRADGSETVNDWRGYRAPPGLFSIAEAPFFFMEHPSIWTCIYRTEFIRKNALRFVEAAGASWTDNLFQVQTLLLARKIVYVEGNSYHYGCSSLRNMLTPYIRSHEIHDWLETQGMTDGRLWSFLYRRELAYIASAFEVAQGGSQLRAWIRETRRLTARWK